MIEYYSVTKEQVLARHKAMKEYKRRLGFTRTSAAETQQREIDEMKRLNRGFRTLSGNQMPERNANSEFLFFPGEKTLLVALASFFLGWLIGASM